VIELCFDGRFIKPEHPDGISRFSLGLIHELRHLCELTVLVSNDQVARKLPHGVKTIKLCDVTSPLELFTALRLNHLGVKVLFSPMQTTSSLGKRFKLILTLHDLIYYRHRTPPREFNWLIRLTWRLFHLSYLPQRLLLNKADLVATVSNTTKAQMLEHRLTNQPIEVIYNAADAPEAFETSNRSENRNLVYMGSFIGYKNVETLIRGMHHLPQHTLVLLSRISERRRDELQALAQQVGAKVRFENGVSEAEYHNWLLNSQALVTASLDEGFGIPVIEAMERGLPVVASNLPIFEEIGGGALLSFERMNPLAFAEQVQKLSAQDLWQEHSDKSIAQAKRFSWQRSAERLIEVVAKLTA
jgi:glycosyltransferase involved in cell wall biosynthesis